MKTAAFGVVSLLFIFTCCARGGSHTRVNDQGSLSLRIRVATLDFGGQAIPVYIEHSIAMKRGTPVSKFEMRVGDVVAFTGASYVWIVDEERRRRRLRRESLGTEFKMVAGLNYAVRVSAFGEVEVIDRRRIRTRFSSGQPRLIASETGEALNLDLIPDTNSQLVTAADGRQLATINFDRDWRFLTISNGADHAEATYDESAVLRKLRIKIDKYERCLVFYYFPNGLLSSVYVNGRKIFDFSWKTWPQYGPLNLDPWIDSAILISDGVFRYRMRKRLGALVIESDREE